LGQTKQGQRAGRGFGHSAGCRIARETLRSVGTSFRITGLALGEVLSSSPEELFTRNLFIFG